MANSKYRMKIRLRSLRQHDFYQNKDIGTLRPLIWQGCVEIMIRVGVLLEQVINRGDRAGTEYGLRNVVGEPIKL